MGNSPPKGPSRAEEGSQIRLPTQTQNDLRQLERAGAASESQRDQDAVDAVRHDAWNQHAGRGGPGPRAATRRKAKLCSEEGSHSFLQQICILARSEQPEPSAKASVA